MSIIEICDGTQVPGERVPYTREMEDKLIADGYELVQNTNSFSNTTFYAIKRKEDGHKRDNNISRI